MNKKMIIGTFGLSDAQISSVESNLPIKGCEIMDTDCFTDIVAISEMAIIVIWDKLSDDDRDLLIDFSDGVGTKDFMEWCAKNNTMYLNTGETDWEENWYSIFDENIKKNNLREEIHKNTRINKYPIVLQHGNNPGLVSHFVKAGLEYIVNTQFNPIICST